MTLPEVFRVSVDDAGWLLALDVLAAGAALDDGKNMPPVPV